MHAEKYIHSDPVRSSTRTSPVLLCAPVSMVFVVKIRIFPLPQSHFGRGAYIVRQGAAGDTFYIISEGKVKVTQKKEGMLIRYRVILIMIHDGLG